MSDLKSILDIHDRVKAQLPEGSLGAGRIDTVTGKISAHGVLDHSSLQACLDRFKAAGGWLQYQGRVVRPQDFHAAETVPAEHPDWGKLLDAELFGEGAAPGSLAIRCTGDGWLAAQWQPGEGETFLAETVERRGLGGPRLKYLRLWQEREHELQPASAWLVSSHPTKEDMSQ